MMRRSLWQRQQGKATAFIDSFISKLSGIASSTTNAPPSRANEHKYVQHQQQQQQQFQNEEKMSVSNVSVNYINQEEKHFQHRASFMERRILSRSPTRSHSRLQCKCFLETQVPTEKEKIESWLECNNNALTLAKLLNEYEVQPDPVLLLPALTNKLMSIAEGKETSMPERVKESNDDDKNNKSNLEKENNVEVCLRRLEAVNALLTLCQDVYKEHALSVIDNICDNLQQNSSSNNNKHFSDEMFTAATLLARFNVLAKAITTLEHYYTHVSEPLRRKICSLILEHIEPLVQMQANDTCDTTLSLSCFSEPLLTVYEWIVHANVENASHVLLPLLPYIPFHHIETTTTRAASSSTHSLSPFAQFMRSCATHHSHQPFPVELMQTLATQSLSLSASHVCSVSEMASVLFTIHSFCHSLKCGVNEVTHSDIHKLTSCHVALLETYYPLIQSALTTTDTTNKSDASDSLYTKKENLNSNRERKMINIDDMIKLANCYLYSRSDHFLPIVSKLEQSVFNTLTTTTSSSNSTNNNNNINIDVLNQLNFAQIASVVQLLHSARLVGGTACNVTRIEKISERIGNLLKENSNQDDISLSELSVVCFAFAALPQAYPSWFNEARTLALRLLSCVPTSSSSYSSKSDSQINTNNDNIDNGVNVIDDITRLRLALSFPSDDGLAEHVNYETLHRSQLIALLPLATNSPVFATCIVESLICQLTQTHQIFSESECKLMLRAEHASLTNAVHTYLRSCIGSVDGNENSNNNNTNTDKAENEWTAQTFTLLPLITSELVNRSALEVYTTDVITNAVHCAKTICNLCPELHVALVELLLNTFFTNVSEVNAFVAQGAFDLLTSAKANCFAVSKRKNASDNIVNMIEHQENEGIASVNEENATNVNKTSLTRYLSSIVRYLEVIRPFTLLHPSSIESEWLHEFTETFITVIASLPFGAMDSLLNSLQIIYRNIETTPALQLIVNEVVEKINTEYSMLLNHKQMNRYRLRETHVPEVVVSMCIRVCQMQNVKMWIYFTKRHPVMHVIRLHITKYSQFVQESFEQCWQQLPLSIQSIDNNAERNDKNVNLGISEETVENVKSNSSMRFTLSPPVPIEQLEEEELEFEKYLQQEEYEEQANEMSLQQKNTNKTKTSHEHKSWQATEDKTQDVSNSNTSLSLTNTETEEAESSAKAHDNINISSSNTKENEGNVEANNTTSNMKRNSEILQQQQQENSDMSKLHATQKEASTESSNDLSIAQENYSQESGGNADNNNEKAEMNMNTSESVHDVNASTMQTEASNNVNEQTAEVENGKDKKETEEVTVCHSANKNAKETATQTKVTSYYAKFFGTTFGQSKKNSIALSSTLNVTNRNTNTQMSKANPTNSGNSSHSASLTPTPHHQTLRSSSVTTHEMPMTHESKANKLTQPHLHVNNVNSRHGVSPSHGRSAFGALFENSPNNNNNNINTSNTSTSSSSTVPTNEYKPQEQNDSNNNNSVHSSFGTMPTFTHKLSEPIVSMERERKATSAIPSSSSSSSSSSSVNYNSQASNVRTRPVITRKAVITRVGGKLFDESNNNSNNNSGYSSLSARRENSMSNDHITMIQHASQDGADVIMHAPLSSSTVYNNSNTEEDNKVISSSSSSISSNSNMPSSSSLSSSSGAINTNMDRQNVSYRISNPFFNNNNNNNSMRRNDNSSYNNQPSSTNVDNAQTIIHGGNDARVEMNFMQQVGVHKISGYNLHEQQHQQQIQNESIFSRNNSSDNNMMNVGISYNDYTPNDNASNTSSSSSSSNTTPITPLAWQEAARRVSRISRYPKNNNRTRTQQSLSDWLSSPPERNGTENLTSSHTNMNSNNNNNTSNSVESEPEEYNNNKNSVEEYGNEDNEASEDAESQTQTSSVGRRGRRASEQVKHRGSGRGGRHSSSSNKQSEKETTATHSTQRGRGQGQGRGRGRGRGRAANKAIESATTQRNRLRKLPGAARIGLSHSSHSHPSTVSSASASASSASSHANASGNAGTTRHHAHANSSLTHASHDATHTTTSFSASTFHGRRGGGKGKVGKNASSSVNNSSSSSTTGNKGRGKKPAATATSNSNANTASKTAAGRKSTRTAATHGKKGNSSSSQSASAAKKGARTRGSSAASSASTTSAATKRGAGNKKTSSAAAKRRRK